LQTSAVVSKLSDTVQTEVNNLFTDCVVATGKVVGSIFLATDELFGVEELTVCSSSHFINDGRFKIHKDSSWDVLSSTSFTKESVEGIITSSNGLVTWHLAIRLNAMLEAIKFPASISNLNTSLANVNGYALSHFRWKW
jgi:hypothetical protein